MPLSGPLAFDPSGPPVSVKGMSCLETLIVSAAAGYFLLVLIAIILPTQGATRSMHVQWKERQRIAVEAAQQAGLQVPAAEAGSGAK
jgi:hypothetical protein